TPYSVAVVLVQTGGYLPVNQCQPVAMDSGLALRTPYSHPPCDSTTLRQASDSLALFSRRQAFICGGLPTCSAQNFPASLRQAICSCGVGPDCAVADAQPAIRTTSETYTEFFMDHLSTI